jgi:hypothetical protein
VESLKGPSPDSQPVNPGAIEHSGAMEKWPQELPAYAPSSLCPVADCPEYFLERPDTCNLLTCHGEQEGKDGQVDRQWRTFDMRRL